MTGKILLAIVDDHQIIIDGLQSLLNNHPNFEIVVAGTDATEVLKKMVACDVDILLTDIQMYPINGLELARMTHKQCPEIKILALSMSGEGDLVNQMVDENLISGYVLKNIGKQELVNALEKISKGGVYFSAEVLDTLTQFSTRKKEVESAHLTTREIEIIKLIEKEMNNKQIAEHLFISERTVETHRKNIFRKTQTSSLIGLIKYAYEHKLL